MKGKHFLLFLNLLHVLRLSMLLAPIRVKVEYLPRSDQGGHQYRSLSSFLREFEAADQYPAIISHQVSEILK